MKIQDALDLHLKEEASRIIGQEGRRLFLGVEDTTEEEYRYVVRAHTATSTTSAP